MICQEAEWNGTSGHAFSKAGEVFGFVRIGSEADGQKNVVRILRQFIKC